MSQTKKNQHTQQISHNTFFGKKGENFVVEYLHNQGYVVLIRNYKSNHGEVDIIAQKNNVVAFVEVKLRNHNKFPIEALISEQKQQKIEKTARLFIAQYSLPSETIFRFDVALVTVDAHKIACHYIESAFFSHE